MTLTSKRTKRSTKDDVRTDDNESEDDGERNASSSSYTSSSRAMTRLLRESQDRKVISAQLTLRFEGMTGVLRNEIGEVMSLSSRKRMKRKSLTEEDGTKLGMKTVPRTRMIKVSQQISRGASSFLVFAGEVFPGTDFRFPVYRRNNHHPFSLSIFVDNVRDVRISTCCENKHQPGSRLGHFRLISVESPFSGSLMPQTKIFRCEACIKGIPWQEWMRRSQAGKRIMFPEPLPSPLQQTPRNSMDDGNDQQRIPSPSSSIASSVPSEMDYKEELEKYNMHSEDEEDDQEEVIEAPVTEMDASGEEIVFDKKPSPSKNELERKDRERDEDLSMEKNTKALTIGTTENQEKTPGATSLIDYKKNEMRVRRQQEGQRNGEERGGGGRQDKEATTSNRQQHPEGDEEETSSGDQRTDRNQVESLMEELTSPSSFDVSDEVTGEAIEDEGEEYVEEVTEIEGEVSSSSDVKDEGPAAKEGNKHQGKLFHTKEKKDKKVQEQVFEFAVDVEDDLVL